MIQKKKNWMDTSLFIIVAASLLTFMSGGCRGDEALPFGSALVSGTGITPTAEGLKVDFGNKDAWPNIRWRSPGGTGWDWSKYEALVFTLSNPGAEDVSFHVKINDVGQDGKGRAAQLSGSAPAGATTRFFVSLQSRALREKSGMRNLPPLQGDYGTLLGTGVEPSHIEEVQIFRAKPTQLATLLIKSITLQGQTKTLDLNGIMDRYGQYTRADWPNKIHSDTDLLAQKTREEADLKAHPALPNRSKWGGWMDGPRQRATGFFHTAQVDGKWWLVDPDGYLFLSVGIDVVRPDLSTRIAGRESMFSWLPDAKDPLADYYGNGRNGPKQDYNFLRANLFRKYGASAETGFNDRSVARLKSWGFNSLGNWTPEKIGQQQQFPYVVAVGTKGGFATVPGHNGDKMPDPFDAAFATDVESNLAPKAAAAKNDPAVIGYFFDNELPWGMPTEDEEHYALCYGALSLGENSPAKSAFVELLMARYNSVADFNAAWKTSFTSWDELKKPFKTSTQIQSEAQRQDFSAFLSAYADKYFEVVSGAVKRNDPNHLYLGCRFAFWFTEEAVRSAAKYADVISFNIYNWNRNTYLFAQNLGKPCIVGEFHFGATDRGMFSGNITVKDQQARAESYANYIRDVLSEPAFVGCHWFQFYDEPTTGRGDGENFNIGFASTTDTPYSELISAARSANAQIYQQHTEANTAPAKVPKAAAHIALMNNPIPPVSVGPAGVETDPPHAVERSATTALRFPFAPARARLIAAVLHDQTDGHAELGGQVEWLLHPSESVQLQGNAFALENTLDGTGTAFLKLAPSPGSRATQSNWDVRTSNEALELNTEDGYPWKSQPYQGGKWGRIAAFHTMQRALRPYNPTQDGLFLTNTWGDRNRDAHLNSDFMAREIEAGARLGADVVQLDDGWQEGTTANSSKARGNGAWNGFWATDPNFWGVNKTRFPQGLTPLANQAKAKGVGLGLWFAPDSSQGAANWERDADALLRFHHDLGVDFFKIDALKIESPQSEANFAKIFQRVKTESKSAVSFDLDITAEKRFGYFGQIEPGRLFIENRYTDWHSYWPHQTLRAAWQLAHWVDPVRLRLEWLNNERNANKYADDPLAPSQYRPDALFATTMIGSPLGWFENQNLPASYYKEAAPLIRTWRAHRQSMQSGTVLPVGEAPDGKAWTGFVSINAARNGGYVLLFRELNDTADFGLDVPLVAELNAPVKVIGGEGNATLKNGTLQVHVPQKLRFLWVKFGS